MKFKIDTEFFEHQMEVRNITKENIYASCKINQNLINELTNDNPIELMKIVKIARFLKVNLYHLIKI